MRATRKLIPRPLKRLVTYCIVWLKAFSCRFAGPGIRLSLAGVLPRPGRFIRGGKVKLVHLRERFGDRAWRFNTLYIVSSTLPSGPDLWMRRVRKAGGKVVWNQNGVAYPAWAGTVENVARINAPMRLLQEASHVVYQSAFCKESADRWVGPAAGPWSIIPNCVDTAEFSPRTRPEGRPVTLVSMGSHFTPEKLLHALEALAILRADGTDIRMRIAGRYEWPGADEDMRRTVVQLGLEGAVEIHGSFLQSEAPALYRSGDIFVHLKYMDPCPTAVIEAMSCGLPVVGSASGGMPELVGEAGMLIPVPKDWDRLHYPDPQSIAEAVRAVARDLPRLSRAARDRVSERFDSRRWVARHEELFHGLIS